MKFLVFALLTGALVSAAVTDAHALSIAIDVPLQVTLDSKYVDKDDSAKADDQTVTDVSGFKVLVAGDSHIGVGYESYEWNGRARTQFGPFDLSVKYQFYDLFLDLPTKFLNFTLGYGMGTANATIEDDQGGSPKVKSSAATQWFGSIGYPFSDRFDLHVAYHAVSTEEMEVDGGGKLTPGGTTLMAGARFGW